MRIDPVGGREKARRTVITTATAVTGSASTPAPLPTVTWREPRIVLILVSIACVEALAAWCDPAAARYATTLPRGQVAMWNVVTAFGTSGYMFAISAALAFIVLVWRQWTRDTLLRTRLGSLAVQASFFFACIAMSGIAAQAMKHMIGRMRPKFVADTGAFHVLGPTLHRGADSFPSAHTTSAFAAAVAIRLVAPRMCVPMLIAAGMIGLSRVATGNHYPSDVIAGAALGASVSFGIAVWLGHRGVLPARTTPATGSSGSSR